MASGNSGRHFWILTRGATDIYWVVARDAKEATMHRTILTSDDPAPSVRRAETKHWISFGLNVELFKDNFPYISLGSPQKVFVKTIL